MKKINIDFTYCPKCNYRIILDLENLSNNWINEPLDRYPDCVLCGYISEYTKQLREIDRTGEYKDEEGYPVKKATDWAIEQTKLIIETALELAIAPIKIRRGDDSIIIYFSMDNPYADIEIFYQNTSEYNGEGEVLAITSDRKIPDLGGIESWGMEPVVENYTDAILKIGRFISKDENNMGRE